MLVPREPFSLDAKFLDAYRGREPAWGPLGLLVYARTYAAPLPDGGTEVFWQTCQRVIEGMYQIQKGHCKRLGLPWSDAKAQDSAQEAYTRMFAFKWLPPGRGLSKMGTDYLFRYGGAALFNCAAYTTENIGNKNIPNAFSRPFTWTLIMSMLGVGVGLDTRGAGTVSIINPTRTDEPYVIPDSREGWSDYLQRILEAYVDYNVALPNNVDYSLIRPLGAPIKGFGGTASGPGALQKISSRIHTLMRMYMGKPVDSRFIVDLANSIGECVVAGGTRRSSQILFSTIDDENFMRLKDWTDPETAKWPRWASNNSVFVDENSDFSKAAALTASNGEPGYLFLNNAREYGRMSDPPDYKDTKIVHTNPCQPAHATVLTPDGISTMGGLRVGDTIWSGSRWTRVVNKVCTGVKSVYEYHTRAGIFVGTANHRVVSDGEKVEVGIAQNIDTAQGPASAGTLDPQDILDGLVIGDGLRRSAKTRDKPNKRVLLCVGANDQDYFKSEVAHLIHEEYSKQGTHVVDTTLAYDEVPGLNVRLVPSRFYFGSPAKMRGFLRGLYSANGSLCDGRVTLKSVNAFLIYEVQEMLSALGIQSYYTVNKPTQVRFRNGEYLCAESYDLNITTARTKFAELIGFIQAYKTEKLNTYCHTLAAPRRTKNSFEITDIVELGDLEVFDITVAAEEHTYWTGGLLVSNCGEIGLMSAELCNLVETFPHNCNDYEDYERTLKFAYLYAKTVTLVPTHDEETNAVMLRNRRIGCSQSGIQDNITKIGLRTHLHWCDKGYQYIQKLDAIYSDWLCIPRSIKTTTVKPSGCRPWDALTSTDKGLLTLQELFDEHEDGQQWSPVQEPVYALQGDKKSRITKTYVNGPSSLVRLTLSYGITLESTPQHQWYVTHNYDRTEQERLMPVNDWVAADKLFVGDILDFNLGNYTNTTAHKFKHLNTTAIKMRCDHAPIKQPKEMTEDIAWLLGYLWGDGAMSPNHYRVRFVDQHEAHLIKCQRIMQDNFGVTANITTCKDRDAKSFDVSSKYLWHWLIKNDVFKYHSDKLDIIPAAVRRSSRDHIVAFIAGLIDADGCVSDKGDRFTVMIASAEDLFAKHLQHVAWSVGLGFGRSLNSLGANFQRPLARHVWLMQLGICVTPEASAVLIRNSCKMAGKGPWNYEVAIKQSVLPGKILKIETVDETVDTYDVEVEDTHWYYAGAFKSHNTISKLVGCREGIHHEKSEYILQAIRIHNTSPLIEPLRAANYRIEEAVNEPNTVVVYFPIHSVGQRPAETISMWEQLELGALMQFYWCDNLTSQTIDFDKEKEGPFIQQALEMYAHRIKGTSFLPRNDHGYVQAPKTPITKEEYEAYVATLKPYSLQGLDTHDSDEKYCSNGLCELPLNEGNAPPDEDAAE